jgi:hypothetical protein
MSAVLRWPAKSWETNVPLTCRLFGHVWRSGWWGDKPYLKRSKHFITDGTGRTHYNLDCRCDRCDKELTVAHIHGETNV